MPKMEKGRPPENKRSRKPAHPVKREVSQDMKNFAESTMNELLGWYGYDKVDLQDSDASDVRSRVRRHHVSVLKENSEPKSSGGERKGPCGSSASNGVRESICFPLSPSSSSSSPRTKDLHNTRAVVPIIKPSVVEEQQTVRIVCVWCQQEGLKRYCLIMGSELKSFCSEKCFAMCRRAYFKRNKAREEDRHGDQSPPPPGQTAESPPQLLPKMNSNTRVCDWCKHVRHTKYLDFAAGEDRLQFCTTKCLNQYKMDIFYREARAALTTSATGTSPRPEEQEGGSASGAGDGPGLLTPESWDSPSVEGAGTALSPKTPGSAASMGPALPPCALSSGRTSVSAHQPRQRESSAPSRLQTPPPPPLPPPPPAPDQLHSFLRPPFRVQGIHSPARPTTREPGSGPAQRAPAHLAPHVHTPSAHPPHLPILPPYPGPVLPCAQAFPPPLPPFVPSLGLPCAQATLLVPYPIIVPLPVPVPIPIPIPMNSGVRSQTRVIWNHEQKEERETYAASVIPTDVAGEKSEEAEVTDHDLDRRTVKTERPPSPAESRSPPFSPLTQRSSTCPETQDAFFVSAAQAVGQRDEGTDRQVIQRVLHRLPVKQESESEPVVDLAGHRCPDREAGWSHPGLDDNVTGPWSAIRSTEHDVTSSVGHVPSPAHSLTATHSTHSSLVLRKALGCGNNTTSVVTPTVSVLSNSTATAVSVPPSYPPPPVQASPMSSDRLDSCSEHRSHATQILAPPPDSEDVKENLSGGRELVLKCPGEQTDCQTGQSEENRGRAAEADSLTADEEHTYARSIPPKLREKNAHTITHKAAAHTLSQLITQTWDKSSHTHPQAAEQSCVHMDAEPALKRRCLSIRDQNK